MKEKCRRTRMAVDLLCGEGEKAKGVLAGYKPLMGKTEYLDFQTKLFKIDWYDGETESSKI